MDCGWHTAVVLENKDLYTFGLNLYGQLGDDTIISRNTPKGIASNVKAVACGGEYTAFITYAY